LPGIAGPMAWVSVMKLTPLREMRFQLPILAGMHGESRQVFA
jgi:hypothetical protein